jgi:hypothetical protein
MASRARSQAGNRGSLQRAAADAIAATIERTGFLTIVSSLQERGGGLPEVLGSGTAKRLD